MPPWELAGMPETAGHELWVIWGTQMLNAEAKAEERLRKAAEREARRKRMSGRRGIG